MINLLKSPNIEVVEQAIWGIGNIAGDGPRIRDIVIDAGAVDPIADILDSKIHSHNFTRTASWTLSNFCSGRPAPNLQKVKRCLPSLARILIQNEKEDIIEGVC